MTTGRRKNSVHIHKILEIPAHCAIRTVDNPGSLNSERSDHFGHCDVFIVVDLDDYKAINGITIIQNGNHDAGGCIVPVKTLQDAGAEAILVGSMAARPKRGFADVGIAAYFAVRASMKTVKEAVEGFAAGRLPVIYADQVCKGSGNCAH